MGSNLARQTRVNPVTYRPTLIADNMSTYWNVECTCKMHWIWKRSLKYCVFSLSVWRSLSLQPSMMTEALEQDWKEAVRREAEHSYHLCWLFASEWGCCVSLCIMLPSLLYMSVNIELPTVPSGPSYRNTFHEPWLCDNKRQSCILNLSIRCQTQ